MTMDLKVKDTQVRVSCNLVIPKALTSAAIKWGQ